MISDLRRLKRSGSRVLVAEICPRFAPGGNLGHHLSMGKTTETKPVAIEFYYHRNG